MIKSLMLGSLLAVLLAVVGTSTEAWAASEDRFVERDPFHRGPLIDVAGVQPQATNVTSTAPFTTSSEVDLDLDLDAVSPDDVFAEVDFFAGGGGGGGGGYPYEEYEIDAKPTLACGSSNLGDFPWGVVACACGYEVGESITVTLRDPAGELVLSVEDPVPPYGTRRDWETGTAIESCYSALPIVEHEFLPGEPLGTYSIELLGQSSRLTHEFTLEAPHEPLLYYSERLEAHVLTGFDAFEEVRIVVYRGDASGLRGKPVLTGKLTLDENGNGLLRGGTLDDSIYIYRKGSWEPLRSINDDNFFDPLSRPTDYDKLIELNPDDASAYYGRARSPFALDPIGDLGRAIELKPGDALVYLARGEAYELQVQFDAAIADYTRAIELDPTLIAAYKKRASLYQWMQNYENALADYDHLLESGATDTTELLLARARVHRQLGHPDEELADLTAAIEQAELSEWESFGFFDLELTVEELNRAIDLDPTLEKAYLLRAVHAIWSWEFEQAIQDLTSVIEMNPTHVQALQRRAFLWAEQGFPQEALDDYTAVLHLDPGNLDAHVRRARLLEGQGRYAEAIADYGAVIDAYPNFHLARYYRSQVYAQQGEHQRALEDLDFIAESDPDASSLIFYARARSHEQLGDEMRFAASLHAAVDLDAMEHIETSGMPNYGTVEDFSRAIELDPTNANAYFMRGVSLLWNDNAKAFADFSEAIALNPDFLNPYHYRAELSEHAFDDLDGAIADTTLLIEKAPDDASRNDYLRARASLYLEQGEVELAIADLTRAIEGGDTFAIWARTELYERIGDYEKALADLAARLDDPYTSRASIYYARFELYERMNNAEEAMAELRRAVEADEPSSPDGTIELYSRVIDAFPDLAHAYYLRGVLYAREGEPELAMVDLTRASELGVHEAALYAALAEAYLGVGEIAQAIDHYTMALELSPHEGQLYDARASLYLDLGDYRSAVQDYTTVMRSFGYVPFDAWLRLCLEGTASRAVDEVMVACEQAVRLATLGNPTFLLETYEDPDRGLAHFARGFARAYAGDFPAATQDLRMFQSLVFDEDAVEATSDLQSLFEATTRWLAVLESGRNPFAEGIPDEIVPLAPMFGEGAGHYVEEPVLS